MSRECAGEASPLWAKMPSPKVFQDHLSKAIVVQLWMQGPSDLAHVLLRSCMIGLLRGP